ncbi:MAG: hypothetical protein ACREL5_08555 [Gemmatimonadales bacterium]
MAGWVPPFVGISVLVIAICSLIVTAIMVQVAREARTRSTSLARELANLHADLQPTLEAVRRLSERGVDVAELAHNEAQEIVDTTRRLRSDVDRGVRRAKERLAEFDAVIGVIQEEIETVALDVTTALSTARQGAGMIARLRRLVRPRRRGRR